MADRAFWHALGITLLYTLGSVPISAALSLLLALGLQGSIRGKGWLRTAFYLPVVIPTVAVGLFWKAAFQPQVGLLNTTLRALDFPTPPWLAGPKWALIALIIVAIWRYSGFYMVAFLVGLNKIPPTLYDAARLDGASSWKRFWLITWPLLQPTVALVLISSSVFSLQVFALAYVMTGGGPSQGTTTLVMYLYERGFGFQEIGYGATLAWALVLLAFPLTALGFWLRARRSPAS